MTEAAIAFLAPLALYVVQFVLARYDIHLPALKPPAPVPAKPTPDAPAPALPAPDGKGALVKALIDLLLKRQLGLPLTPDEAQAVAAAQMHAATPAPAPK